MLGGVQLCRTSIIQTIGKTSRAHAKHGKKRR